VDGGPDGPGQDLREEVMIVHGRIAYATVALAGLAALTACGTQFAAAPDTIAAPAAVTSTIAPGAEQVPPEPPVAATTSDVPEVPVEPAPIPEPTIAKVQKWVKIYSGPSAKRITPLATTRGSHTVELTATNSDRIGTFVTDGAGRTLYRFDNDSARPPKSTCNGDCAKTWPPLLIKSPGKIYPKGVNPKILGYVERADGHCQVTINGHPVYYFAGDAQPGDINGQGLKGVWFAVNPTGGRTHAATEEPETLSYPGY
jgi:predicted lipoprotein with Yx(FWY)xxD motif